MEVFIYQRIYISKIKIFVDPQIKEIMNERNSNEVLDGTKETVCEAFFTSGADAKRAASINESCFFNEQCEMSHYQTECREGHCVCRFEMTPFTKKDGTIECSVKNEATEPPKYIDPAMIGVLVGMALMFIILCVVLRLFSKARWRENRTIFNTPNPRLMNVSLLRDSKLLHGPERRGSRASVRGPSRQPSIASLRPQSPQSLGSRRGSHASSNASATSNKSQISPTKATASNSTVVPNHTESVTVEVQEPKM
ncbi:hypothetical protein B7P43_G01812 [Cryptotermes secundus]|uniref:EB domain-containing protein n=1 Tax=Cryptotermes secundus TaxID=105785 RepID=A0A2J7PPD7_9NEOP|nr:hypothetical protein B7P43_G01812 [Cryptotermes secundus]